MLWKLYKNNIYNILIIYILAFLYSSKKRIHIVSFKQALHCQIFDLMFELNCLTQIFNGVETDSKFELKCTAFDDNSVRFERLIKKNLSV